jgi:hypothetical protein
MTNRKKYGRLLVSLLLLMMPLGSQQAKAQALSVTKLGESLIDDTAFPDTTTAPMEPLNLRAHQIDAIVSFKGYQYAIFYTVIGTDLSRRYPSVARRPLPNGAWETIRFTDYVQNINDSHRTLSMGICEGDGTIHMSWDHHGDVIHYRVSNVGLATNPQNHAWVASEFGPVLTYLPGLPVETPLTYPAFVSRPDGNLTFNRRLGSAVNGKQYLYSYDQNSHAWTNMGMFINGSAELYTNAAGEVTRLNGYPNGLTYSGNRLHVSWVWRTEGTTTAQNFDFMYAYSDDYGVTWRNNAGLLAGTIDSDPMTLRSTPAVKIFDYPEGSMLANQTGQAADSQGRLHVVQQRLINGVGKFIHLYQNSAGTWVENATNIGPGRHKIALDKNDNAYLITRAGVIYGATLANNYTDWTRLYNADAGRFTGEAQFDRHRMEDSGVISMIVQSKDPSTEIHSIDWRVGNAPNTAPTISNLAGSISMNENGTNTVSITVGDAETAAADLTVRAVSSNPSLVPDVNLFFGGSGSSRTVAVTPKPFRSGSAVITLIVTDGVLTRSNTFNVTVQPSPSNTPPTINNPATSVTITANTATGALPFTIGDGQTPVALLEVTATSSDSTLVPPHGIFLTGSGADRTVTITPALNLSGTTTISLMVNDGSLQTTNTFLLIVLSSPNGILLSHANDTGIKDESAANDIVDQTVATTYVGSGGTGAGIDRCLIFPFQLPNLGAVANPFTNADFTFDYVEKNGTLKNTDLQGLGRRTSPVVLPGDYYGQTTTPDPTDATLIQTNMLVNATPLGLVSNSTAGSTALRNYLNNQYAAGAGSGSYVFLRLNTSAPKSGANRAELTMAEGAAVANGGLRDITVWPRINYTVASANAPPTISNVTNQTISEDTATAAIPFVIGDPDTPVTSLTVTATSSDTTLVPNANVVFTGTGANRTVTVTPAPTFSGTTIITLTVADGALTSTDTFTLTVTRPSDVVLALAGGGPINSASTWDRALPTVGDTQLWRTGANAIRMAATPETFNGGTFVLQPGGTFAPGITSAVLTLNNVLLNGGSIIMNVGGALTMDLSGDVLTLNSGTLKSGGIANTRDVKVRNGSLAGSGTIQITGTDTTGSDVEFQSTVAMKGFTGIFDVKDNGILNLPFIGPNSASFDIILSGTGKYANDASVSLTSLVIDGTPIPPGVHTYSSFTPAQQAYFTGASNTFTITINNPPTITMIATQDLSVNTAISPLVFTIGDVETAATALTLTRGTSNTTLVPGGSVVLGGSGANRTVTITPVANKLGTATITLNVSDGTATTTTTFAVNVTGTAAETWRFDNFGTTANTGNAAALADPNKDGESNLLEYATGQNPNVGMRAETSLMLDGNTVGFIYARSIGAMTSGVIFTVEYSDTLTDSSWSSAGITEQILADDAILQSVKAACPKGSGGDRFIRLRVTQP